MAAAHADCYRRVELCDEARAAFHEAVQLTEDLVEREYLLAQIRRLPNGTLDVTT